MDHSKICNEAIRPSFLLPKRPAKAKFRMQDFAGNNLVGTIPYLVVETFNQPLRRHWNLLRRSCATTSSGLKFLRHADSTPSTHFLKGGADTPLTSKERGVDIQARRHGQTLLLEAKGNGMGFRASHCRATNLEPPRSLWVLVV